MYGYPNIINSHADLENLLADDACKAQALTHLQTLMDEQYGYDAAGVWGLVGGGGLARLGISRAEATALGALDKVVPEPTFDLDGYKMSAIAQIDAACNAKCASGIAITWGDTGRSARVATATPEDWTEITGVATAGLAYLTQGATTTQEFQDEDGVVHTLTPTQAMAMGSEAREKYAAIKKTAHDAIALVQAVTETARSAAMAAIDTIVAGVPWTTS